MDKEERMDPAAQELKEETMTAEPMDEETRRASRCITCAWSFSWAGL